MKNIYYIENEKPHLVAIRNVVQKHGYKVFPNDEEWQDELKAFVDFLHDQGSKEKSNALEEILDKHKPDVILIDVDLGCNSSGDGGDIYDNFMLYSRKYSHTPVIYLTIASKSAKRVNRLTRHVTKIVNGHNLDANAISKKLLDNIKDLLTPPGEKGFFDRVLDSI